MHENDSLKFPPGLLERLVNSIPSGVVTCDEEGNILSWNHGAKVIFGFGEHEAVGQSLSLILPKNWMSLKSHQPQELVAERKGGSNVPVAVTISTWESDFKTYLSLIIRDLTDRKRIEGIAEETQEIYDALLTAQSDIKVGVSVIDIKTQKINYANEAFCRILGYTFEELRNLENFNSLVPVHHRELQLKRNEKKIIQGMDSNHFETIFHHKDGSEVYVDMAIKQVDTSLGLNSIVVIRDITARKIAENALIASERQKGFIIDSAGDMITTTDTKGVITSANLAFKKVLGFTQEEVIGRHFSEMMHPDDAKRAEIAFIGPLDGKTVPYFECRNKTKSGDYINTESSTTPLIENGMVVGSITVIRDISERKKHEKALEDERTRLKAITEATFEGIAFTENGIVVDVSDNFVKMFGYSDASEVIGMRGEDFGVEPYRSQIRERLKNNAEQPFTFIGIRKDGSTFEVEVAAKIFRYQDRTYRVASLRDVSSRSKNSGVETSRAPFPLRQA